MSSDKGINTINAIMIIEIMGRPPEHLIEALDEIASKISEEKGVTIINKTVNEPVLLKDQTDFYSTYMELEVEVEEPINLTILMFKYMPAHVEVLSPEKMILTNNTFGDLLNEVARRLHGYEEVARVIQAEKKILENQLRTLKEKK